MPLRINMLNRLTHWLLRHSTQYRDRLSTLFILILLVALFEATQTLSRINHIVFDLGQQWGAKSKPVDDIVIVSIDQQSLATLGNRTWPRNIHAALIERLSEAQAKVIGYDFIFAEPDLQMPHNDVLLTRAVQKAGNVVFPVLFEQTYVNGPVRETMPIPSLAKVAAGLGSVHAVLDEDSIVRGVYLYEGINNANQPLFASRILEIAQQPSQPLSLRQNQSQISAKPANNLLLRRDLRLINFSGKPGHFKTISFSRVIAGDFHPEDFKGKMVLVGATAAGMNDMLTTPMSAKSVPMAGVEFHANVLQSSREGSLISLVTSPWSVLIQLLFACVPLVWLPRTSPRVGFVLTVTYSVLLLVSFALVPKWFYVWCPSATAFVVSFIAFPVWSWRKLEATQHYINLEIVKLNQKLNDKTSRILLDKDYDYLDRRIMHLRQAASRIEQLQAEKDDTLTFLSHDIKAPLATALLMINQQQTSADMLRKPLEQAFTLAETFLQTARAERFDNSQMQELELINLTQQVIDDAYAFATQQHIKIKSEFNLVAVWLEGNYGLLSRAIFNLIHNAVKYSVMSHEVSVRIYAPPNQVRTVVIEVDNLGEGIPVDKMDRLFKRFQRLSHHEQSHEGTGLGLYFTKVVVDKHAGTISVGSFATQTHGNQALEHSQIEAIQPQQITRFSISLPFTDILLQTED